MLMNVSQKYNFCFLSCLLSLTPLPAADLSAEYTWKPVQIGGGGWVTGLVLHPAQENLAYARTDVGGVYKWDADGNRWTQLITASRMPADLINLAAGNPGVGRTRVYQVESIAIAPSDPSVLFVASGSSTSNPGILLKSTDGGESFTWMTGLSTPMAGNAEFRMLSERLAVKPDDAQVVLFGSRTQGLWRSANGGSDWSQIPAATLPFGTQVNGQHVGVNSVVFDPATPSRVYASVANAGIYRSNDAGLTWTQILNLWAAELEVSGGTLFACGADSGLGVRRYNPATNAWTNITPNSGTTEIAVDPADANRIFAVTSGFQRFYRSTNGGSSWKELSTHSRDAGGQSRFQSTVAPWKESSNVRSWLSIGALSIDPFHPSRLWFSEGMGMWRAEDTTNSNNAPVFTDISTGIEEMVATDALVLAGGKLVTTVWDRLGFVHADPDVAPAQQIGLTPRFTSGWSVAGTPASPGFAAVVGSDHRGCCGDGVFSGITADSGGTWSTFASVSNGVNNPSSLRFGELAVAADATANMVWLPRNGGQEIRYTTNGGATWQLSSTLLDDFAAFYFGNRRRLVADGAAPATFYVYRWTDGKILRSTNGGGSFSATAATLPTYTYWSQLRSVPGQDGHLLFVSGRDYWDANGRGLYRSTNAGASFTKSAFFNDAWAVGTGAPPVPGDYPTIYVFGRSTANQWGVFRSTDQAATWDRIAEFPLGIFDNVTTLQGDPETFGRVFIGWSGNSFAYGEPTQDPNEAPRVEILRPVGASVHLPDALNTIHLEAVAQDDAGPPALLWTQVSGPGVASFDAHSSATPTVSFSLPGEYVLRVTADDGFLTAADDILVRVGPLDPSPGALLWLRMEETCGETLADAAGTNPAQLTGTDFSFTAGMIGGALRLDGGAGNTHADSSQGLALDAATGFSAAAWIRPEAHAAAGQFRRLFQQMDGNGTGRTWLAVNSEGRLYSAIGNQALLADAEAGTLPLHQWNHVAVTLGGGILRIYLNGSEVASAARNFEACAGALRIGNGKSVSAANQWRGAIDELRVHAGALSPAHISAQAARPAPGIVFGTIPPVHAGTPVQLAGRVSGGTNALWTVAAAAGEVSIASSDEAITEVTFAAEGLHRLRLTGVNETATAHQEVEIQVLAPLRGYALWASQHPALGELNGPMDDADGDGVVNLLEFAFGLNPLLASREGLPVGGMEPDPQSGEMHFTLTYRQRRGGVGTPGIDYTVEGILYRAELSTTLTPPTWLSGPTHFESAGSPVDNSDGTETVTVRLKPPVGPDTSEAFLRVGVLLLE